MRFVGGSPSALAWTRAGMYLQYLGGPVQGEPLLIPTGRMNAKPVFSHHRGPVVFLEQALSYVLAAVPLDAPAAVGAQRVSPRAGSSTTSRTPPGPRPPKGELRTPRASSGGSVRGFEEQFRDLDRVQRGALDEVVAREEEDEAAAVR